MESNQRFYLPILDHPAEEIPHLKGGWIALLVGLFWLLLPWFGLPGPHPCDDLVFVAPALDFAQARPMSSHIVREACEAGGLDSSRWLCHPPVYQQILGLWLRVFGISNGAMLWFQVMVGLTTYCGLLILMRRFRIHAGWSLPPAAMLFMAHFHTWGMRPEALGIALLVLGVVFSLYRDPRCDLLVGVFWIASGVVSQQAGIYAGLFILVALADNIFSSEEGILKWQRAAATFAGGCLPVLCFLYGIGWDIPSFIRAYTITLKGVGGMAQSRTGILSDYWAGATLGWEWIQLPVIVLLVLVVAAAIMEARDRLHRWLLMALVAGLAINILAVRAQAYRLSFMYALIAIAAFCILGAWRDGIWLRVSAACICLLVVIGVSLPDLVGQLRALPTNADEIRKVVARADCTAVFFDDYAAWYVFGWRLPEKAQSLQNSKNYSPFPPRAGEIYVVQESAYRQPHLQVFGREFRSVNLNNKRWDVVDFRGNSLLSGNQVGLHVQER